MSEKSEEGDGWKKATGPAKEHMWWPTDTDTVWWRREERGELCGGGQSGGDGSIYSSVYSKNKVLNNVNL